MIVKNEPKNTDGWPVDGVLAMYMDDWSDEDVAFHAHIAKLYSDCRDGLKKRGITALEGKDKRLKMDALDVVVRELNALKVKHHLRSRQIDEVVQRRETGQGA